MSKFQELVIHTVIPCREDPEAFFVSPIETEENTFTIRRAKKMCAQCPIRVECLTMAMETGDQWAILGGMTPAERQTIREQQFGAVAA